MQEVPNAKTGQKKAPSDVGPVGDLRFKKKIILSELGIFGLGSFLI